MIRSIAKKRSFENTDERMLLDYGVQINNVAKIRQIERLPSEALDLKLTSDENNRNRSSKIYIILRER